MLPFYIYIFQALFRIAVGLLKVQQPALLQLCCPLEIMQYMKRAARVTYDKDQIFKVTMVMARIRTGLVSALCSWPRHFTLKVPLSTQGLVVHRMDNARSTGQITIQRIA